MNYVIVWHVACSLLARYVEAKNQLADILTKPLQVFLHRDMLNRLLTASSVTVSAPATPPSEAEPVCPEPGGRVQEGVTNGVTVTDGVTVTND